MKRPGKPGKKLGRIGQGRSRIDRRGGGDPRRYRDDWQEVGAALRTRSEKSSPVSISTPISAAWRSAPRRLRSAAPSSILARRESIPSSPCGIPRPRRKIRRSPWYRRAARAGSSFSTTIREARVIVPNGKLAGGGADRRASAQQVQPGVGSGDDSTAKLVTAERREEDAAEATLRPQRLAEFIGQEQARKNLGVFIEAARARREALDHVLFVGPPGTRQDHCWRRSWRVSSA